MSLHASAVAFSAAPLDNPLPTLLSVLHDSEVGLLSHAENYTRDMKYVADQIAAECRNASPSQRKASVDL